MTSAIFYPGDKPDDAYRLASRFGRVRVICRSETERKEFWGGNVVKNIEPYVADPLAILPEQQPDWFGAYDYVESPTDDIEVQWKLLEFLRDGAAYRFTWRDD